MSSVLETMSKAEKVKLDEKFDLVKLFSNFGLSFTAVLFISLSPIFSKFKAKECRFFGLLFGLYFMTHLVTGFVSPEILQH